MERIKISNFRKIKGTWEFDLAPITFFTGKNNSGKSSALKALMVLSDFTNTLNHFELNFLGENSSNHKIENYSNSLNWTNNKKSNISFEFERNGHLFVLEFSPKSENDQDYFQNGILQSFVVINIENKSKIEIYREGGDSYQMKFDYQFLAKKYNLKRSNAHNKLIRAKREIEKEIEKTEIEIKKELGIDLGLPIASKGLLPLLTLTGPVGTAIGLTTGLLSNYALKKIDDKTKITLKSKLEKLNNDLKLIDKKLNKENIETISKKNELIFSPSFKLAKLFESNLGLNNILTKVLIPYLNNNIKKFGEIDVKDETIKLQEFCNELMETFQFDVDHLSPHRCNQERLILNEGSAVDISELAREQVKKSIKKGSRADLFIKEWMDKFDIGIDYDIISVQGQATIINVFEKGIKQPINISDKGFGAGQIFTILLQIAQKIDEQKQGLNIKKNYYFPISGQETQIVIIEEPEANLHPNLQSKLAELFFIVHKEFNIRFIIETHSEYMIRKSQLLSLEDNIFKLYYFDTDGPYEMVYTNKGGFSRGFGEDFYDMNDELALELVLKSNS